jgi:uncharacterized membrane protein
MNSLASGTRKSRRSFIFLGILLVVLGMLLLISGSFMMVFNRSTDAEGYHLSDVYKIRTSTYAFELEIGPLRMVTPYARLSTQLFGVDNTVQAKWVVIPQNPSKEIFVGFTTAAPGKKYVSQMQTEGPPFWTWNGPYTPKININTTSIFGQANKGPLTAVTSETFWITTAYGKGPQNIKYSPVWDGQSENRYIVFMNLDGSKVVEADLRLGFKIPIFERLPFCLIPVGLILSGAGILLIKKRQH